MTKLDQDQPVDAFVVRGAAYRRDDVLSSDLDDLLVPAARAPGVGPTRSLDAPGS